MPSGLIVLAETAEADAPCKGVVKAVGPGKYNRFGVFVPTCVAEGDQVIFSKTAETAGTWVKVDNENFLVLADENILGLVEETE